MERVLITGGTGELGRELATRLIAAGHAVRILSRRTHATVAEPRVEHVRGNLAADEGIREAVRGIDTVAHCASDFSRATRTDVLGTARLLDHARESGVGHVVYPGIVGSDRVPTDYYRAKTEAEARIEKGGVAWSIVRATQFHSFIDTMLRRFAPLPLCMLPPLLRFQPVDTGEVADALVAAVAAGPSGRLPEITGPRVFTLAELLATWSRARQIKRWLLPLPHLGASARAIREGALTSPTARHGVITWESWLEKTYGAPPLALE